MNSWETYESLHVEGVPFDHEPTSEPWGTQAIANDSFGTDVVLVETVN